MRYDAFDSKYAEESVPPPNTKETPMSDTLKAASASINDSQANTDHHHLTIQNNSSLPIDGLDASKSIASANMTHATEEIDSKSLGSSLEGQAGGYQSRIKNDIKR